MDYGKVFVHIENPNIKQQSLSLETDLVNVNI